MFPRLFSSLLLTALLNAVPAATVGTAEEIRILPTAIQLSGPAASHRVLVERFDGSQAMGQVEGKTLKSDHPDIVRVDGSTLYPVANGTATVRVEGSDSAVVKVEVTGMDQPFQWSFRNHVEPVLARLGCSSGACHGALAGKGGFRLSLRGYDPDRDFFTIVEQQQGRRVELLDPATSLLLTKPTMATPHKGGLRLTTDSIHYKVLSEWIASGAAPPAESDARLRSLEVLPERVSLTAEQQQPLLVRAHYSDGHVEDVTHLAKFTSSNEAVATVDEHGLVKVVGSGEGAVTAWFSSQIVIARVTVPFPQTIDPSDFTNAPRRNFIDDLVLSQLQRLNLKPSPRCSDDVFIRRAYLDTIGTLPTSSEVRAFVADTGADKRDRLIESLLSKPEFVDYWTYRWSDLLLLNGTELRPDAISAYYGWIRGHIEKNSPWDQMVRELVTSRGSSFENGATNFFARHQAPEDMAENVSQAFLGLSIGCARCHNHPLEKWTNDQYYAFANLFSRVRAKGWGGDPRNGDGLRTLVTVSSGELVQPRTGKPQRPAPLDAEPIDFDAPGDRREYLAEWLTSPQNRLFARSVTNRVWKNYFGVGLVEQVDDMRASNPASNEELLEAAAKSLVDGKYDLKALMRTILQSETYQRSSETLPENAGDQRYYSRYFPRRLLAEVLLDAVSQVTEVPTEFSRIVYPGADIKPTDAYPKGTRAIQLKDSAVDSYFLQTFGRNQRRITCECERSDEPSMVQVLHLSNGTTLNEKLAVPENRLARWMKDLTSDDALVDEIFLTCLSRGPTEKELAEIKAVLAETSADQRRLAVEDLIWGIVSSREFLFNH
ncbi:MAG: DUF1553 domain-containing protein [Planctomycetaceae bacterium]|nr:DUF1553 domain-containing protein [Planctomycetaceae bacterium]